MPVCSDGFLEKGTHTGEYLFVQTHPRSTNKDSRLAHRAVNGAGKGQEATRADWLSHHNELWSLPSKKQAPWTPASLRADKGALVQSPGMGAGNKGAAPCRTVDSPGRAASVT